MQLYRSYNLSTKNKIDKNYLINIIEEILLNDGISGLSIRKVATKANISIGGVQYIFGNKEGMIKAIASKSEQEYNYQIELLSQNDNSKYSKIKAHIEYLSNYDTEENHKIARVMTMLLQDEFVLKDMQKWYRNTLVSIDTSSEEGKKLRLALFFAEGFLSLLSQKYLDLSNDEQKEIFEDLKTFLL